MARVRHTSHREVTTCTLNLLLLLLFGPWALSLGASGTPTCLKSFKARPGLEGPTQLLTRLQNGRFPF